MSKHYIYVYLDPRNDIFRYVGQGVNRRRNWWRYVKVDEEQYGVQPWLRRLRRLNLEPVVMIVAKNLTMEQANEYEIALIDLIGRVAEGTGPLLNLSAGGKGSSCKRNEVTRRKHSEIMKVVCARPEVRQRYSEARKADYKCPEVKQRHLEAARAAHTRPEVKQRHSEAARRRFADPEARCRQSKDAKIANARPEVRQSHSDAAKACWARRKAAMRRTANEPSPPGQPGSSSASVP